MQIIVLNVQENRKKQKVLKITQRIADHYMIFFYTTCVDSYSLYVLVYYLYLIIATFFKIHVYKIPDNI